MNSPLAATVAVIDFRRRRMVLDWNTADGSWAACDAAPAKAHGVALIRASPPNVCIYAESGRLRLQVGRDHYALAGGARISCERVSGTFGFRRRFTLEADDGTIRFNLSYWTTQHRDFFCWMAVRAADPGWRTTSAQRWTEGVAPAALRSD
jgi:hypothetical protein